MTSVFRICLLTMTLWSTGLTSVWAHNVIGTVYVIGDEIEGEVGYSNGDMAPAGTPVTVSSVDDVVVAELETDAEGFFIYRAAQRMSFKFHVDLGAGHIFDAALSVNELAASELPANELSVGELPVLSDDVPGAKVFNTKQRELDLMIQKAVAKQIKPLRKTIKTYQARVTFQDILGGIGYIFGLCGLAIWFRQRKDRQVPKNEANTQ